MAVTSDPSSGPWSGLAPAAITFCEADLGGWIMQPANTWSNLAYWVVGGWLILLARREGRRDLAAVGVIEILIGFGSFFFHMSGTHLGEVVDVGAMYLLSGYVLVKNVGRLRARQGTPLAPNTGPLLFSGLVLGSTAAIALFKGELGVILFSLQAIVAGHLEVHMRSRFRDSIDYRPLVKLLVCFSVAWAFWWLDIFRIFCNPDNHWLQFHAVWHLINSAVFVFIYRFYAQFRDETVAH